MTKTTATEPAQRLTDLQRVSIAITGGLVLWGIAYAMFSASVGLAQDAKITGVIIDNYWLVVLEAAFGWILLLVVVPRTWKFLIPVCLVTALPTLLTIMYGLGLGLIYIYSNRAAAAILCCLFWLLLGWQIWSWGNTKKKKPRKP